MTRAAPRGTLRPRRYRVTIRRLGYFAPPHKSTPQERAVAPSAEPGFDVDAEDHDAARQAVIARLAAWGEKYRAINMATDGKFIATLYAKQA